MPSIKLPFQTKSTTKSKETETNKSLESPPTSLPSILSENTDSTVASSKQSKEKSSIATEHADVFVSVADDSAEAVVVPGSPSSSSEKDVEFIEFEEKLWKRDEAQEAFETAPSIRLNDGTIINPKDLLSELKFESFEDGGAGPVKPEPLKESQQHHLPPTPPSAHLESCYKNPLPPEKILSIVGPRWTGKSADHPGLIYHAHIFPDDTPLTSPNLKPRRPTLHVRADDFFSSIVKLPDNRYIFSGILNGWPGFGYHLPLEVLSITYRKKKSLPPQRSVRRWWTANYLVKDQHPPSLPPRHKGVSEVRVTLRTPPWAGYGWSPTSPGLAWHFDGRGGFRFGRDMVRQQTGRDMDYEAVRVHMFQHRYAMPGGKRENPKDLLTYHSAILIEWEDKEGDGGSVGYVTVVELALLNGIGGYRGRSNWYHDKDDSEKGSLLYRSLRPELVLPWHYNRCELRIMDLPHCPTIPDFVSYMKTYQGPGKRFLDAQIVKSHKVRLTYRTKRHMMQYCLNNVERDGRYSELGTAPRNCQTFTADFFAFLVGKKGVEPIGAVTRMLPGYVPRMHLFMYDAEMYRDDKR